MQLTLKALFDDDTRKQIRDAILDQAKAVARAELTETIRSELERKIGVFADEIVSCTKNWGKRSAVGTLLHDIINDRIKSKWTEVGTMIEAAVQKAADAVVAEIIADTSKELVQFLVARCEAFDRAHVDDMASVADVLDIISTTKAIFQGKT